jgi:hypothetical protein
VDLFYTTNNAEVFMPTNEVWPQ